MKNAQKIIFPELLQAMRRLQGLSRKEVAADLNMSYSRLVNLEMGRFYEIPGADEVEQIALYYGVTYDFLKEKLNEWLYRITSDKIERKINAKTAAQAVQMLQPTENSRSV